MDRHEISPFLNNVRIAVAVAIIRLHAQLIKLGQKISIEDLCLQLSQTRENWSSKCMELRKEVKKLQVETELIKSLSFQCCQNKNDQCLAVITQDSGVKESFLNLQFHRGVSCKEISDTPQLFVSGLQFIENCLEKPRWPRTFLLHCSQVLSKSFRNSPYLHEDSKVLETLMCFVEYLILKISNIKKINQQIEQETILSLLSELISGPLVLEMSLMLILDCVHRNILALESNDFCCEFENLFYLFTCFNILFSKFKLEIDVMPLDFHINLRGKISKIYFSGHKWSLVNYKTQEIIQELTYNQ